MEVNIAGMENLNKDEYNFINRLVEKTARHSNHIQSLNLNVQTHRTSGARQKFSIHAKALTDSGFFKAEATDWKVNLAIKDVIRKLDRHIHHELEKK
tara:strand:+ start:2891 stop:3181 length:291 start_codon:yes stop_codon:yes gene_type:complete